MATQIRTPDWNFMIVRRSPYLCEVLRLCETWKEVQAAAQDFANRNEVGYEIWIYQSTVTPTIKSSPVEAT